VVYIYREKTDASDDCCIGYKWWTRKWTFDLYQQSVIRLSKQSFIGYESIKCIYVLEMISEEEKKK
jgi:hypothetical protein